MPVLHDQRQYRNFVKNLRALDNNGNGDGKSFIVEGYALTFDDPYLLYADGEIEVYETISRSAFDNVDLTDVIFQFDHNGRVYARTSNGTLYLEADAHGLKVRADLGGTETGRQLYEEIKGGYITKMSWGFSIDSLTGIDTTYTYDETAKKYIENRTIKEIKKIYDVSAVSIPANDATEISARNLASGALEKIKGEHLKRVNLDKLKLKLLLEMEV